MADQISYRKTKRWKELEAEMEAHAEEYKLYQEQRSAGVLRAENPHLEGYKAYRRAYNELLGIKRGQREKAEGAAEGNGGEAEPEPEPEPQPEGVEAAAA